MDADQGTTTAQPDLPGVSPSSTADAAKAAALEKQLAEAKAKADKLERAQKKREADAKADADAKAVDDGKAKELLAAQAKELAAARERLEKLESAERERGEKLWSGLPKASQQKLESFREKLDPIDWASLIEAEASQLASAGGSAGVQSAADIGDHTVAASPPPTGSAIPATKRDGKREPSQAAMRIVQDNMLLKDDAWLRELSTKQNEEGGVSFTMPIKEMFARMKTTEARSLDKVEDAVRRIARNR